MDIAKLGIAVDTSDLKKSTAEFGKVKNAAAGLSTTLSKLEKVSLQSAVSMSVSNVKAAKAKLADLKATKDASKADMDAAKMALRVAQAQEEKARKTKAAAIATADANKVTLAAVAAQKKQVLSTNQLVVAAGGAARDQGPNRFNTANIAAQFQDIGVTAAMGMNPLTVALQQGTQLSAILNSMKNPLEGLKAAFTSVINPVSLLSIGLVALTVAGIQMVNWSKVAEGALSFLADTVEYLAPAIIGLGVAMAVLKWQAVVTGATLFGAAIVSLGTAVVGATATLIAMSAAMLATPWGRIAALAGVLATGVAYVSGAFGRLADAIRGTAKVSEDMSKASDKLIKKLVDEQKMLDMSATAAKRYRIEQELLAEETGEITEAMRKQAQFLSVWIAAWEERGERLKSEKAAGEFNKDLLERTKLMELETKALIENTDKARMNLEVYKLRQEAMGNTDIISTDIDTGAITKAAARMLELQKQQEAFRESQKKDPWKEMNEGAMKNIATLQAEQDALGLTAEAAAVLKYETELLNEAKQKDITLTPQQIEQLRQHAAAMGSISTATAKFRENVNFASGTTKSFVKDMTSGLREGKSAWESFGNSVLNVLNKVIDKLIDLAIEAAFSGIKFGSSIGGLFGGGVQNVGGNGIPSGGFAAATGAPAAFAKGGAFTNSVVNKPTTFAFANGGAFGTMGEAGPEAIMPLKRGPDGSLGVQVNGSQGGGTTVILNVNNNSKASASTQQRQTSQGTEIDVIIDDIVSEKLGQQGTATNRSINAYNSRQLIKRG